MLYEFELGLNTVEATKNICYAQGKGTVICRRVPRLLNRFRPGCRNLDDQARPVITRSCSKSLKQSCRVAFRENLTTLACNNPVWFVNFTNSVKPSRARTHTHTYTHTQTYAYTQLKEHIYIYIYIYRHHHRVVVCLVG